jgi:hypothetical protein
MTLLDKLLQMKTRLRGEVKFPPPAGCHDTQIHIAGVFLRMHIDELIEAVRKANDASL